MKNLKTYGVYILVSLGVMLPLILPGFILTLDMVFTPSLPMPNEVTSSYLFHAMLHMLNFILPGDVVQKLLLLTILPLASIGMHRLIRTVAKRGEVDWGIYIGSIFYAINPFTYSRFMAGQYAVLLGYALLPWLVRLLLILATRPSGRNALKTGLLVALIGIVSIHTLGAVAVLIFVGALIWRKATVLRWGAAAIGIAILLSSYWLVPLALGQGKTAATVGSFSAADSQAFATNGSNPIVRTGHILRLQGFWAEDKNLYLLPQDRMVLWGLMALVILAIVITGGVMLWSKRRNIVIWLGASAVVGIVLAAGLLGPWTADVPLLAGLREPHKLVALVALAYSALLAFGINTALERVREEGEMWYSAAAVTALALPFLFTRAMLWGFDGQLTPRHYPADWFTTKQTLQVGKGGRILFLPWHQYMTFEFAGRTIASPAPAFFGPNILVSQNPELGGASGGTQPGQEQAVTAMLQSAKTSNNLADQLAKQNILYVLLAKEVDYKDYDYLQHQPNLTMVHDSDSLILYKNEAWSNR